MQHKKTESEWSHHKLVSFACGSFGRNVKCVQGNIHQHWLVRTTYVLFLATQTSESSALPSLFKFHVYFLLMHTWLIYFLDHLDEDPRTSLSTFYFKCRNCYEAVLGAGFFWGNIHHQHCRSIYFLYLLIRLFSREKRPVDKYSQVDF